MGHEQAVAANSMPAFPAQLTDEIQVTGPAQVKLGEIVAQAAADGVVGIRVYVSGGGCSGMTYGMVMAEAEGPRDAVWTKNGLKIFVDAVALSYLDGAEIDYTEEGEPRFLFRNVFARSGGGGACGGCGSGGCGSH
ncbi:iron-sulfur cluster assembly accessory protein [Acidiferrobacter sp.]|uniref:HesB/IscA family protein n=1 Tax=Acidiferrobacter sp. TaxID=1872107 RepID=UPI002636F458|nr:iron-sulfur cluster assembly accessory protein [Acidiferrobacter sp.]